MIRAIQTFFEKIQTVFSQITQIRTDFSSKLFSSQANRFAQMWIPHHFVVRNDNHQAGNLS